MIEKIRNLSRVVDTTKGTLQLQILFALRNSKEPMTPDELSQHTGRRRKSIMDALLKLKRKGLVCKVEKDGELAYKITENGSRYMDELLGLLKHEGDPEIYIGGLSGMVELLPLFFHIYDAILSLGIAGEYGLTLEKIADIFGLSPERAETYMDLFIDAPGAKLFKKIKGSETRYCLTEEGKRVFSQLPYHLKSKRQYSIKFLSLVTRSTHPRKIYSRLSLIFGAGSLITSVAAIFSGSYTPFLVWVLFITFFGVLACVEILLNKV